MMKHDKGYYKLTVGGTMLVPAGLIGTLTEILMQCPQIDYVFRDGPESPVYLARRASDVHISSGIEVRTDTLTVPEEVFSAYKKALKTTTGNTIIGVEEWSKLNGHEIG